MSVQKVTLRTAGPALKRFRRPFQGNNFRNTCFKTDRQTGRKQAGWQAGTQAARQTDKERERDRQTARQRDRQPDTDSQINRQAGRQTDRQTDRRSEGDVRHGRSRPQTLQTLQTLPQAQLLVCLSVQKVTLGTGGPALKPYKRSRRPGYY